MSAVNEYLAGCHRIRIRTDYDVSFLGIRSQSIPHQPDEDARGRFDVSPSTYGWVTNGGRIRNGRCELCQLEDKNRDTHVFALKLNCDERRLAIADEYSEEHDEIEVSLEDTPFPWCLFVQLPRRRARVSLV